MLNFDLDNAPVEENLAAEAQALLWAFATQGHQGQNANLFLNALAPVIPALVLGAQLEIPASCKKLR